MLTLVVTRPARRVGVLTDNAEQTTATVTAELVTRVALIRVIVGVIHVLPHQTQQQALYLFFFLPTSNFALLFLLGLQNNQQTSSWSITLMVVVGQGMRTGAHLAS